MAGRDRAGFEGIAQQVVGVLLLGFVAMVFCGCEPADPSSETLHRARVALEQQNFIDAVQLSEQAISQGAMTVEVHLIRGHSYLSMKKYPHAIDAFDTAVKFDPYSGEALLYKGLAEQQAGQADDAKISFEKAISVLAKLEAEPDLAFWKTESVSESQLQQVASEAAVDQALALSLAGRTVDAMKKLQEIHENHADYVGLPRVEAAIKSQSADRLLLGLPR